MVELKYKHALDSSGKVVSVSDAVKGVPYFCVECGQEMVFCKGEKVRSYFRHRNSGDIERFPHDNETYLHRLAKKVYEQRMIEGEPVICDMEMVERCNQIGKCPVYAENCCERFNAKEFNLMDFYEYVGTEVRSGKYTPDILLKNKKTGKPLFFEVWVKHKCTDDKLQNNNVIEVKIENEEDILTARPVFLMNDENYETRIHYFKENIGSFNGLICNTFNKLHNDKEIYNYSKDINTFISLVRSKFNDIDYFLYLQHKCLELCCDIENERRIMGGIYQKGIFTIYQFCNYCQTHDYKCGYECAWTCPIYRLKYSIFYPKMHTIYKNDKVILLERAENE